MRISRTLRAAAMPMAFAIAFALSAAAQAVDTVGCSAKVTWRQSVVETIVRAWYESQTSTDDLLNLISAEHGIAACQLGQRRSLPLHTPTLPRDLQPGKLGGLLLSNELSWSHLLPEPEEGLSGHAFTVVLPQLHSEHP